MYNRKRVREKGGGLQCLRAATQCIRAYLSANLLKREEEAKATVLGSCEL